MFQKLLAVLTGKSFEGPSVDSTVVKKSESSSKGIVLTTYRSFGNTHLRPFFTELSHPEFNRGLPLTIRQYFSEKGARDGHYELEDIFVHGNNTPDVIEVLWNRSADIGVETTLMEAICFRKGTIKH